MEYTIQTDPIKYLSEKGTRDMRILHHAALFAVTRWTNIYFSSDFIGGPMKRLFGKGVKDEVVPRKSVRFYPGGHTRYWEKDSIEALQKIAEALHLRSNVEPKPEAVPED